jgi:hypothetical protein
MLNKIIDAAFETAHLAEIAWSDELKRIYGNRYGEARYDRRMNASTPELALLNSTRREALNLWHKLCVIRDEKEAA